MGACHHASILYENGDLILGTMPSGKPLAMELSFQPEAELFKLRCFWGRLGRHSCAR